MEPSQEFFDEMNWDWSLFDSQIGEAKHSKTYYAVIAMLANAVKETNSYTSSDLRTCLRVITDVLENQKDATDYLRYIRNRIRDPGLPTIDFCSRLRLNNHHSEPAKKTRGLDDTVDYDSYENAPVKSFVPWQINNHDYNPYVRSFNSNGNPEAGPSKSSSRHSEFSCTTAHVDRVVQQFQVNKPLSPLTDGIPHMRMPPLISPLYRPRINDGRVDARDIQLRVPIAQNISTDSPGDISANLFDFSDLTREEGEITGTPMSAVSAMHTPERRMVPINRTPMFAPKKSINNDPLENFDESDGEAQYIGSGGSEQKSVENKEKTPEKRRSGEKSEAKRNEEIPKSQANEQEHPESKKNVSEIQMKATKKPDSSQKKSSESQTARTKTPETQNIKTPESQSSSGSSSQSGCSLDLSQKENQLVPIISQRSLAVPHFSLQRPISQGPQPSSSQHVPPSPRVANLTSFRIPKKSDKNTSLHAELPGNDNRHDQGSTSGFSGSRKRKLELPALNPNDDDDEVEEGQVLSPLPKKNPRGRPRKNRNSPNCSTDKTSSPPPTRNKTRSPSTRHPHRSKSKPRSDERMASLRSRNEDYSDYDRPERSPRADRYREERRKDSTENPERRRDSTENHERRRESTEKQDSRREERRSISRERRRDYNRERGGFRRRSRDVIRSERHWKEKRELRRMKKMRYLRERTENLRNEREAEKLRDRKDREERENVRERSECVTQRSEQVRERNESVRERSEEVRDNQEKDENVVSEVKLPFDLENDDIEEILNMARI